jgi:hypothetical protein
MMKYKIDDLDHRFEYRMTNWILNNVYTNMKMPYDVPNELMNDVKSHVDKINKLNNKRKLYSTPLGANVKVTATMTLKQLYYMIELRSKHGGHKSYINVVRNMYEKIIEYDSSVSKWIKI